MAISTNRSHPENTPEGQKAKDATIAADTSTAEAQQKADEDTARGFRGIEVDSTPNENYTIAGVTSGAPTPETDEAQAEQVRKDQADVAKQANGVAQR